MRKSTPLDNSTMRMNAGDSHLSMSTSFLELHLKEEGVTTHLIYICMLPSGIRYDNQSIFLQNHQNASQYFEIIPLLFISLALIIFLFFA